MTKVIDGMKAYCLLDALTIEREIASENKETFKFRTPNFAILCSRLTELCNLLGRKFCPPVSPPAQKEKRKVNHIRIWERLIIDPKMFYAFPYGMFVIQHEPYLGDQISL